MDNFCGQIFPTEGECLCFGFHVNVKVIVFDGATAVFTGVYTIAFDGDFGTKRIGGRTGEGAVLLHFHTGRRNTVGLSTFVGRRRIGRGVYGEFPFRQGVPQVRLFGFPRSERMISGVDCFRFLFNRLIENRAPGDSFGFNSCFRIGIGIDCRLRLARYVEGENRKEDKGTKIPHRIPLLVSPDSVFSKNFP